MSWSKQGALAVCLGGAKGLCVQLRGTTPRATNAAGLILAASAGTAIVMAGYGAFRYLTGLRPSRRLSTASHGEPQPAQDGSTQLTS